ncbi:MAG: PEP-CTERM sorting domain-containing protein [Planctomycetota bacterium]
MSASLFAVQGGSEIQADLVLDLADIVGGGDGTGNGSNQGINMLNGNAQGTHTSSSFTPGNSYIASSNPFVDGVFTPDGGFGGTNSIQISSTGISVTGISDTNAQTWDHIWNGLNVFTNTGLIFDSIIGAHASKGITFDLDAIESANPGMSVSSYALVAANGNHVSANIDYYVFGDGALLNSVNVNGQEQTFDFGSNSIGSDTRFLTLVASSNGDHFGDWSNWINPTLTLQPVPEPSATVLFLTSVAGVVLRRRRSR